MPITPSKFPNEVELDRIANLRKYALLYENKHYVVFGLHEFIKKQYKKAKDIVYLAHNLPAYVSDFYGDFVAGETDQMVINPPSDAPQEVKTFVEDTIFENDLKEKITDIGTEQSEFGFVALHGWLDESQVYHIDMVGQDQYFPQPDGSVIFLTYKEKTTNGQKDIFALAQEYSIVNGNCQIVRTAWKCDGQGVLTEAINYKSYFVMFGGTELPETELLQGMDDIPVRQIDNTRKGKDGFGKSDYVDIMPQLSEINERSTHVTTQLMKTLDAKMQVPSSMFDEDGKLKPFETIAVNSKEDPEAKYITNSNPLLDNAEVHIERQLRTVSLLTAVPMWELLKSAMPERVESMRIQLFAAVRRTDRKRARVKRALNDMFRIGFKLKGITYDKDMVFKFSDVLPTDELNETQIETSKVTAGLSSKQRAIMRLENMTEEEADAELTRIREEDTMSGMNFGAPPAFNNEQPVTE